MNYVSYVMAGIALIAAIDRIIGNKLGLGEEFEKGILLTGTCVLSMVGLIVFSPLLAKLITPLTEKITGYFDPSVIPALFFANDLGGGSLCMAIANSEAMGKFNGLVAASMMGCTVSFTIPYFLGAVKKDKHKDVFLGMLCGIITTPLGYIVGGLCVGINFLVLLINALPLCTVAAIVAFGVLKAPNVSTKIFSVLGIGIKVLITVGLAIAIFEYLTGIKLIPYTGLLQDGMDVVISVACILAGAFPLINILSRIFKKPLKKIGNKSGLNETSALGFFSTLAAPVSTFGLVEKMDRKGIVLNSAFAVSASCMLSDHLAYTLAIDGSYLLSVIVAKMVAGIAAVVVAVFVYKKTQAKETRLSLNTATQTNVETPIEMIEKENI